MGQQQKLCNFCSGSGRDVVTPDRAACPVCGGSGYTYEYVPDTQPVSVQQNRRGSQRRSDAVADDGSQAHAAGNKLGTVLGVFVFLIAAAAMYGNGVHPLGALVLGGLAGYVIAKAYMVVLALLVGAIAIAIFFGNA